MRLAAGGVKFTATTATNVRMLCEWRAKSGEPARDVVVCARAAISGVPYVGPAYAQSGEVSRSLMLVVEVSRGGVAKRSWCDIGSAIAIAGAEAVSVGLASYPSGTMFDVQGYCALEASGLSGAQQAVGTMVLSSTAAEGELAINPTSIPYPFLPNWAQLTIYGYQGALDETAIRAWAFGAAQATYVAGWQTQQVGHGMAVSEAWGQATPDLYVDATTATRSHVTALRMGVDL